MNSRVTCFTSKGLIMSRHVCLIVCITACLLIIYTAYVAYMSTNFKFAAITHAATTPNRIHEGRNVKASRKCRASSRRRWPLTWATTGTSKSIAAGAERNH